MTESDRRLCASRSNDSFIMGLGALSVVLTLLAALYVAAGGAP
jgi:hypothetical protein